MEQEKLHVYLMAIGLLESCNHLTKKQLELLLKTDSEKYTQMFFITEPGMDTELSMREKHIGDIFLAYQICYTHLLSLYARPTSTI
jgi:hypothetical protein